MLRIVSHLSAGMSPDAVEPAQWNEIEAILDEEVNRLPEKLRIVIGRRSGGPGRS